jgi:hypothetical protein
MFLPTAVPVMAAVETGRGVLHPRPQHKRHDRHDKAAAADAHHRSERCDDQDHGHVYVHNVCTFVRAVKRTIVYVTIPWHIVY